MKAHTLLTTALLLAPCTPLLAQGGSLTPPGPPGPMMKTLQQIEPRTDIAELSGDATAVKIISAPGSYYLTGDLAGATGKDTIRVEAAAGRVTIDLSGFSLTATGSGRSAILLPATNTMIVIRKGGIVADASATTLAVGGSGSKVVCEDLKITSNGAAALTLGADGIVDRCRLTGGGISGLDRTIVRDCVISAAGINDVLINIVGADAQVTGVSFTVGRGQVVVGDRGLVADCQINSGGTPTFLFSSGTVIQTGAGAVVRDCTVAAGTVGSAIGIGSGSLVKGCRITSTFRDGISSSSSNNVTVESCDFSGFGRDGIVLGSRARIRDCTVQGSGTNSGGIELGVNAVVTGCTANANGQDGITTGADSVLSNCLAEGNVGVGFMCADRTVIDRCLASDNGLTGFRMLAGCSVTNSAAYGNSAGFFAQNACTLENFSAMSNSGDGIQAGTSAALNNCSAASNTGMGISVGDGSTVSNSQAFLNQGTAGISSGFGCTIAYCVARANTSTASSSFGISVGGDCTVVACSSSNNTNTNATPTSITGGGISIGTSSTVKDCTVQGNKGDGIRVSGFCQIIGNTSDGNGLSTGDGAGIHTTSTRNRIEGNTVTSNDRGIDVDSTASLIIGNSAGNNTTNYDIAASNRYGPIIDISASGSAAVTGSSAASVLTTTDPHANFAH